jgi:hypothetical protein
MPPARVVMANASRAKPATFKIRIANERVSTILASRLLRRATLQFNHFALRQSPVKFREWRWARKQRRRQEELWYRRDLAEAPGHPFYRRLNEVLDQANFDEFCEARCRKFYHENRGRPSLAPCMSRRIRRSRTTCFDAKDPKSWI